MKQYCRNFYIRFDDVRNVNNKSSNDAVKLMKPIFREATQWTSPKPSQTVHIELQPKIVKASIVRFTIFRHRRMFYRARKKLKKGWKVKLDLTKSRLLHWRKSQ